MPADPTHPWLRELHTNPTRHSLLAAYTLLTHLSQKPSPAHQAPPSPLPHDPSQRSSSRPRYDPPIRFTHTPDLALPLAELHAIRPDPHDPARHLVTTAISGPLGHDTPLPLALADELDHPLAHALLDRFHHRRTLLLCQGLHAADLAATLDGHDAWSRRISALTGLASVAERDPLAALRLAPIFATSDRSPRALNLALRRLVPELGPTFQSRVEPLTVLTPLAADQRTRLGGPVARLGDTASLGADVQLPGSAARLVLGPLPAAARALLAPGGPAHARLRELLAAFIPEPLHLELHLELEHLSLPPARLGQRTLGRDLWLHATHPTAEIRVPLPLTPPSPPCPPATRSASTIAAAA